AAAIGSGGILLASGVQFASIVLGQDITTGFIGPEGSGYAFSLSESIFLKINIPQAMCVLTA
ncbi:MAG: family 1 encapsulin nanocompartment shell protein, partial [Candidatus Latescibacterota bacterium]